MDVERDATSFTLEAKAYVSANRFETIYLHVITRVLSTDVHRLKGKHDHQHAQYCISRGDTLIQRMEELQIQPEHTTLRGLLRWNPH